MAILWEYIFAYKKHPGFPAQPPIAQSLGHNFFPPQNPAVPSTAGPTPADLSGETLLYSTAVKYYLHEAPDILNRFTLSLSAYFGGDSKKTMILLARGFSPWNHELLNDTCFAGTYILKNVIENQYAFSAFPYYRLTDWGGLINDKNSLFHTWIFSYNMSYYSLFNCLPCWWRSYYFIFLVLKYLRIVCLSMIQRALTVI